MQKEMKMFVTATTSLTAQLGAGLIAFLATAASILFVA